MHFANHFEPLNGTWRHLHAPNPNYVNFECEEKDVLWFIVDLLKEYTCGSVAHYTTLARVDLELGASDESCEL